MVRDDTYSPPSRRRRTVRYSREPTRSSQLPSSRASVMTVSSGTDTSAPDQSTSAMLRTRLRARDTRRTPPQSGLGRRTSNCDDLSLDDDDEEHVSILSSIESRLSIGPVPRGPTASPSTKMVTARAFELRNRKDWIIKEILGRRSGTTWVRWAKVKMPAHMVKFDRRTSFRPFVSLNRKRYYITSCSTGDIDENGKASWLVRWEDEWLDNELLNDLSVEVSDSSSPANNDCPQSSRCAASASLSHTLTPGNRGSRLHSNEDAEADTELWNDINDVFLSLPSSPPGLSRGPPSSVTFLPASSLPTGDGDNMPIHSPSSSPSISATGLDHPELTLPGEHGVDYGMPEIVRQAIERRTADKLFGQQGELRPTLAKWPKDKHPRRRTVTFARSFAQRRMKFNLSDYRRAEAVIVHEIGEEVVPCDSCRDGKGALEGCVVMNHFDKGACTCCRANKTSQKCNFHQRYKGPHPRFAVPVANASPPRANGSGSLPSAGATYDSSDTSPTTSDDTASTVNDTSASSTGSVASSNSRKRKFEALMSGGLGSGPAAAGQSDSGFLPGSSPSVLGAEQRSFPLPPIQPQAKRLVGLPTPVSELVFRRRRSGQRATGGATSISGAYGARSSPAAAKQERSNSAIPVRRSCLADTSTVLARWIHVYENDFGLENQRLIVNEFRHAWRSDFGQSGEPDINKMPAYFCFGAGVQWFKDMAMPLAWSNRLRSKEEAESLVVID